MRVLDIKEIAKNMGLTTMNQNKANLVRAIQLKEGNMPCFGIDKKKDCDQVECLWREDCY